ncbi:hypothetical protein FKM82_027917 [Ascaphus truei]
MEEQSFCLCSFIYRVHPRVDMPVVVACHSITWRLAEVVGFWLFAEAEQHSWKTGCQVWSSEEGVVQGNSLVLSAGAEHYPDLNGFLRVVDPR